MAGKYTAEGVFGARDRFSRVVGKMESRFSRFTARLDRAGARLSNMSSRLAGGLMKVAGAATAVGVAGGFIAKNIIDAGAGFEQAITNVAAVGLQTRDQIADLEAKAKQLGATTKFTATEAAEAMETMARAGFKQNEILSGVEGVLSAAAASGLEMAEVANVVSNSLKGMGMSTDQATRVADVLALASARTNSSIGTLGESMKNVASTARQMNVPFEDAVAAVAALQDVGLDASVAGSALNTMLTKIAAPTSTLEAKMKNLGISFKDSEGNMLPFAKVIEQISIGAKKSGGNMDQVAFLAELVGLRGQKAAANLAKLFETGKLASLTEELQGAAGSAEKMAKIRMDTLEGDMTLFGSAVDAVKVRLFELQGAPLRGVVQGMTKWVSKNEGLIVQKVEDTIKKISDNAEELTKWAKIAGGTVAGIVALTIATKAASLAMATASIVAKTAGVAYAFLGGVVRQVRIAILALTIATNTDTAKTIANSVAQHARSAALAIGRIGAINISRANFVATASTIANSIATGANTAATWLRVAAKTALNAVMRTGAIVAGIFTGATNAQTIAQGASAAATWAGQAAHVAKNLVVGLGTKLVAAYNVVTLRSVAASGAANAAMLPMLATVGAIAAAFVAVNAAIDQYNKLSAELGATGVGQFLGDVLETGSFGEAFNRADERENQLARQEAANRERQVTTPAGAMTKEVRESNTTSRHVLDINAPPGVANLRNPTAAKKAGLTMQPSGA